jgi:predicted N-acetyltransferase YhbS
MPDMLVKLYDLPAVDNLLAKLKEEGIIIRAAMPYERKQIVAWVRTRFGDGWANECNVAFGNHPVSCIIATEEGSIIGFGCHECTCRNYFGPAGVAEQKRGRGIGKVLLLSCLHAMAANGYAYAIIGGVGPSDFYAKVAGAMIIEGSTPGIYRDPLKKEES